MADSKSQVAVNGPRQKHAKESKIFSLLRLAREIDKDSNGVETYELMMEEKKKVEEQRDQLIDQNIRLQETCKSLQTGLQDRKDEAARDQKSLIKAFEERYKVFSQSESDRQRAQSLADKAHADAKKHKELATTSNDQRAKAMEELKDAEKKKKALESTVQKLEDSCKVHTSQLKLVKARSQNLQDDLQATRENLGEAFYIEFDQAAEVKLYAPVFFSLVRPLLRSHVMDPGCRTFATSFRSVVRTSPSFCWSRPR